MNELLETIKQKLDTPHGDFDAMVFLTGKGLDNWYSRKELTLQDIKPGLLNLMVDIEAGILV